MPADLLRIALRHRRISLELLTVHGTSRSQGPVEDALPESPLAVFLQPGGIRALHRLGVEVAPLARQGCTISKTLLLDARQRPHAALDFSSASPWLPMWIPLVELRAALARSAESQEVTPTCAISAGDRPHSAANIPWRQRWCPGIFLRTLQGSLQNRQTQLIWNGSSTYVGIAQTSPCSILMYAVSKSPDPLALQRDRCLRALDEARPLLDRYAAQPSEAAVDQWFPLSFIGYRTCHDGQVLFWGHETLRLHPLTGQDLSYWAIQAAWLTQAMIDRRLPLPELFRRLDQRNRWMFRQHLKTLYFFLPPTWRWRVIYQPYVQMLRASPWFGRHTARQIGLLACP